MQVDVVTSQNQIPSFPQETTCSLLGRIIKSEIFKEWPFNELILWKWLADEATYISIEKSNAT